MKIIKSMLNCFSAAILLLVVSSMPANSFTDQVTTERLLKENKHFIDFINITITNFGNKKIDDFKRIYEKHFNAEVAFLQSDYSRAYKRIYASQKDMVKLYEDLLKDHYLEDSKSILDKLAPEIIRSKNARAKLYLTLGYRDRTVGWTHFTVGEATNPKQYSKKLYKYEKAIKMSRRAKKYGFLALFESRNAEEKRKIYNWLLKKENENNNPFFKRFAGLNEKDFIKEMNKTFAEHEALKKSKKESKEESSEGKYENLLKRRVRFKKEKKLARFLMNQEFDRAEYEIRKYVKDFNFKLLAATFEMLSSDSKKGKGSDDQLKYDIMKVHLLDNYSRLSGESALNSIIDKVKVEDSIEDKPADKSNEKKNKRAPLKKNKDNLKKTAKEKTKKTSGVNKNNRK